MRSIRLMVIATAVILATVLTACGAGADAQTDDGDSNEKSEAVAESVKGSAPESDAVILDYGDEVAFEAALNRGENLEGKTVAFTADELHPDSALGYNIWSGQHLNFVSDRNPDIKEGDITTVRATTITSSMGSWIIKYEKVDAVPGESTITAENSGTEEEEVKPLELVEYGLHLNEPSGYSDEVYFDFCGIVHNPNESMIARFPNVLITLYAADGSILATDHQMGMEIMPDDTVTIVGMLAAPLDEALLDAKVLVEVECDDFTPAAGKTLIRTTDFEISNVNERSGSTNYITGEITNNSEEETNVNLSMVLRKNGNIVYMENTFIDDLKPGKTKAFEFTRYSEWPDHDDIEMSAQTW